MKHLLQPEAETPAIAKSRDPDPASTEKMNSSASLVARKWLLGRLEKVFLAVLLLDVALYFFPAASGIRAVVTLAAYILGMVVAVRLVRRNLKQLLWRLRNRLIVSYLFIAVVPIGLLLALAAIGGYMLMGQVATYTILSELGKRVAAGAAPSEEMFSSLAPNFGDVLLVDWGSGPNRDPSIRNLRSHHVPPPVNPFDIELTWLAPITYDSRTYGLIVKSRPSAVLRTIFGQKMEWEQLWLWVSVLVAGLFLIVQVGSIVVGASMTRTITGAVHDLYEGTQKVKAGDFSHRIAVRGGDQLADLSLEFNRMTENLQRLIVVEKERERLHSELEIAHDVQSRLFPKAALSLPSLMMDGVCHPAQQVSGDYY